MVAFPPQPGTILAGRYRLDRRLADGTIGHTYLGANALTDEAVAVTVFAADSCSPAAFSRFVAEATTVSELQNVGVARLLEASPLTEDPRYLVTEWLDGEYLSTRLMREPAHRLSWSVAVEIVSQCARILAEVHDHASVSHLNITPDSCFLVSTPTAQPRVQLLGFGLSHLEPGTGGGEGNDRTKAISLQRENAYQAPEQLPGESLLDERTDIYALGALLFALVTGRPPFVGSHLKVARDHLHEPPPSPREIAPDADISESMVSLIHRALAKRMEDRFPDMKAFERALGLLLPRTVADDLPTSAWQKPTATQQAPAPTQQVPRIPNPRLSADRTEQGPRIPNPGLSADRTEQGPRLKPIPQANFERTEVRPKPSVGPPLIDDGRGEPEKVAPPVEPRPASPPPPASSPVPVDTTIEHPKPRPPIRDWQRHWSIYFLNIAGLIVLLFVIAYRTQCLAQ